MRQITHYIIVLSILLIANPSLCAQNQNRTIVRFDPDGVKEAIGFEVKFKVPLLNLPKGKRQVNINDMNSEYVDIVEYFRKLESQYGQFEIFKQIPNAIWGDTLKHRLTDGNQVSVPDLSQLVYVKFNVYIPVDSIVKELTELPEVEFAHQPVEAVNFDTFPNDPEFQNNSQWNLTKIMAPKAWDISKGISTITVALIENAQATDTGIPNKNHEDFFTTTGVSKWDATKGEQSSSTTGGHATKVAGIIGAATDNNKGIASLGWEVKLSSYSWSYDASEFPATLPEKIIQAVDDGNKVINCSFGIVKTFQIPGVDCFIQKSEDYSSVEGAIIYATNMGAVVIAAAGNSKSSIIIRGTSCTDNVLTPYFPFDAYPAAYPGVIAVSATGANDIFGEGSSSPYNTGNFIDLSAPGMSVLSTQSTGGYAIDTGTSFAAPHVAALAGLILSTNSSLSTTNVENILTSTAVDLGTTGHDDQYGHGRINAYQALLLAHAYQNKSVSTEATAKNNGRRVVRDNTGKYHVVFESGITSGGEVLSEIFYRNSTDGTTWSAPIRLSTGNEKNRYPSITQYNNKLYAVWQRKVDSSTHDIYFATSQNGGASWNAPCVLASTSLAGDPLPVISFALLGSYRYLSLLRA